jgi:hypothetical protein
MRFTGRRNVTCTIDIVGQLYALWLEARFLYASLSTIIVIVAILAVS